MKTEVRKVARSEDMKPPATPEWVARMTPFILWVQASNPTGAPHLSMGAYSNRPEKWAKNR
jgi:hypothetical protein